MGFPMTNFRTTLVVALGVLAVALILWGCSNSGSNPVAADPQNALVAGKGGPLQNSGMHADTSMNGRAGTMPAYYDGKLFTINFKEMPMHAEASLLAHNKNVNTIYMSDSTVIAGKPFVAVLDAIQGDGFNPLWNEVQITFNAGFTPHQFYSDTHIDSAATSNPPEITLTKTDEVYRCAVIGPKK